jgi:Flagellar assembly protein FliH
MSDANAKPMIFPRVEVVTARPSWLDANAAGEPVRSLLSHLGAEEQLPPSAAQAQAAPEQDAPAYEQEQQPQQVEVTLDERPLSRLPPPPKLGSLIPGGRSAPPPANDVGHPALREREAAFRDAAVELAVARAAAINALEGQLLDLAIEIAAALIEREVSVSPDLQGALARAALASLGDSTHVTMRTSPEAYESICAALGGKETIARGVHVEVIADEALPGLGCIVDGDSVRIDATVSERLRAVRRAFEDDRRKVVESHE